ncbi:MAG: diaminopimelate epimerase [Acidimicrobiales bacterium]
MKLTVTKFHGLGNDFLVALDGHGADARGVDAGLARRMCDRHRGISADGLILGELVLEELAGAAGGDTPGARLTFRLWNADGSDAEMSGNGVRCLAHAAADAGLVGLDEPFGVLTPAGCKKVTLRATAEPDTMWGSVEMGVAKVQGEPSRGGMGRCNVGHGQLLVDVGNPHLVVAGPDPATVDVGALGPALEATEAGGINVEFATLGPGPDEVTMRVWERGVGETLACGTGACAAAVAFHHWGRVGGRVTVRQPGGAVVVGIADDGEITLAGTSQRIAVCDVEVSP